MYADDIVLVAPNEAKAQEQLDVMSCWCQKWAMHITPKKRPSCKSYQQEQSQVILKCCDHGLIYVSMYKYLGFVVHEHLFLCLEIKTDVVIVTSCLTLYYKW